MGLETIIALGVVSIVAATVTSGSVAAAGSMHNANISEANAESQRNTAEYNAELSEREAKHAEEVNKVNLGRKRDDIERDQSRQRAIAAKSGSLVSGSQLEILGDSAEAFEIGLIDMHKQGSAVVDNHYQNAFNYRHGGEAAGNVLDMQAGSHRMTAAGSIVGTVLNSSAKGAGFLTGAARSGIL